MKLLYTTNEAAEALAISRTTLYALLRTGTLRSVRIGTARRIPASALTELLGDLDHQEPDGQTASSNTAARP
jgi:excisionase family DNA binding protein